MTVQLATLNASASQTLHPASASTSAAASYGDPSQLPLVILPQRGAEHRLTTLEAAQPHLEPQPRSKRRRKDTQHQDSIDTIEVEMVSALSTFGVISHSLRTGER